MITPRTLALAFLAISTVCCCAMAAAPVPQNLALNRTYELAPEAKYASTRGDGDRTDLTDGKRGIEPEGSSFWEDRAVVGWSRPREPIVITLDLGDTAPIGGVAVHTGFGTAGVSMPRSIALLVSDDGEKFDLVGDLIRLNVNRMPPEYGEYVRYSYLANSLKTQGRFVRLVVVPSGQFFFCDEIEVLEGDHAVDPAKVAGTAELSQITDAGRLTQLGAYARIRSDLERVEDRIGQSRADATLKAALNEEIATLKRELADTDVVVEFKEDFRAIVPMSGLHERVFAIEGRLLGAAGVAPLAVWHTRPYQLLPLFARPGSPAQGISLDLMLNERRAEVFNLTNASGEPESVQFEIDGLPGGTNPAYVRVFEVQSVDTREGKVCSSALLPLTAQDGGFRVTVPAGMTRQIWLSFEPRDIGPGKHVGTIHIESKGLTHTLEISLNVSPIRFPDQTRLAFSGWDEIINKGYSITDQNQSAARTFVMEDALINGVCCTPAHTPIPSADAFDNQGNLIGPIDFSKWDSFISFWPNKKHYFSFTGFSENTVFAGLKTGTPEFNRAVSQWAAAWAAHNRTLGLTPGQVVVLFVDEPADDASLAASYHFGRSFGEGTDDILTFTDPHINSVNSEWGRKNIEAYDVICPHLPDFADRDEKTQAAYTDRVNHGQQLWFYSCSGPVRMFDPSYYRLQPWHTYLHRGTGAAFWAFGDASDTTSWNEYAAVQYRCSFTPWYIGAYDINTSKHYEAAREGVMDYEYLRLLEDRIAQLNDSPKHQAKLQRARHLLQSLPAELKNNVESKFGKREFNKWQNASQLAEDARLRILKMLAELEL